MRRPTVVYLVLLLALAGVYYYLNNRAEPADILVTVGPTAEISYLFTAEDGTPTSIHIESKAGDVAEVARGVDNAWALILPVAAKADQASAEAAASQVTTMRILETIPQIDLEIVGLKTPEYVLTIKFTSGVERKAEIGVVTPSESGYYVRADDRIVIVGRSSVDSLLGLLTNPPYLETPTPSLTPTLTAIPATASPTPVPSTSEADATATGTATP